MCSDTVKVSVGIFRKKSFDLASACVQFYFAWVLLGFDLASAGYKYNICIILYVLYMYTIYMYNIKQNIYIYICLIYVLDICIIYMNNICIIYIYML